jgi:excisionase family DNA binding protein
MPDKLPEPVVPKPKLSKRERLEQRTRHEAKREARRKAAPPPPTPIDSFYLTKEETARILRAHWTTVDRLVRTGKLRCYKIGRRCLFRWDEVQEAVEGR